MNTTAQQPDQALPNVSTYPSMKGNANAIQAMYTIVFDLYSKGIIDTLTYDTHVSVLNAVWEVNKAEAKLERSVAVAASPSASNDGEVRDDR